MQLTEREMLIIALERIEKLEDRVCALENENAQRQYEEDEAIAYMQEHVDKLKEIQ